MASFLRRKSYDDLPALSIRRSDLRRSLRTVTAAVMLSVLWGVCIGGSHATIFYRMLGFDNRAFGFLAAIAHLATFLQPATAALIDRTGLRKYQFVYFSVVHRSLWVAMILVPLLLPIPSGLAVGAVMAIIASSHLTGAFCNPAWWSWMGDLVPRRIRGSYLATHKRFSSSATIVAALAVGVLLDAVTRKGMPQTASDQPVLLWVAGGLIALGGIFGLLDPLLYIIFRVPDVLRSQAIQPASQPTDDSPARPRCNPLLLPFVAVRVVLLFYYDRLVEPLANRAFRFYAAYAVTMAFATAICMRFVVLLCLESLHFSKLATNGLVLVIVPVCGILLARRWGAMIDRYGRKPVLLVSTVGTILAFVPMLAASGNTPNPQFVADGLNWIASSVGQLWGRSDWVLADAATPIGAYLLMSLGFMILGVSSNAIMMAHSAVRFGFADKEGGNKYLGASFVMFGIGGVIGGLAGGEISQRLAFMGESPIVWGPFLWNHWHILFVVSMVARLGAIFWLRKMPDPGAGRTRDVIGVLGVGLYATMVSGLGFPLRMFRRRDPRE